MAATACLALLAVFATMCGTALAAVCSVNVNSYEMPSHEPLLLKVGAEKDISSFLMPDANGSITTDAGTKILVACPNSRFKLFDAQVLEATCFSGTVFTVNDALYTLNTLACTELPRASAVTTDAHCDTDPNHIMVNIGFTVEEVFYKLYEVCFDTETLASLYTHNAVIAGINGFQQSFPRPNKWETGALYDPVDMSNQYKTQRQTLINLLGALPSKMGSNYLSKGHLAAKADFALGVQQTASFFYANSAPQWDAFNGGNWNQLELDVRRFASENKFDLQVYTGTYGTLNLPNNKGNQTDIYLYAGTKARKVPVPMLFWKLVFEPKSKQAMAFVGVNNPFNSWSQLPAGYKLCPDVCSRVNWLHWKPTNQTGGLAYCCEYAAFKQAVPYVPSLSVGGTFTSGAEATSALKLVTIFCSVWLLLQQSWK